MADKLDNSSFTDYIENSEIPVLVDFYSDGCIPCRRIAPIISNAESKYDGQLKFAKVNIGINPDLIQKYEIEAAPTLILFKNGNEVNRFRGFADTEELKEFIETVL